MKFNSNFESESSDRAEKVEVSHAKNKYKKASIIKRAPNWVQKNISIAASTHFRVFAKLCSMKKEGTNKNS